MNGFKITIEHYDKTYSVESSNMNLTSDEFIEMFLGLSSCIFSEQTVKESLLSLAQEN